MKLKNLLFIILALFIPFIVNAETCDNDKISLELIGEGNHTGFVSEKSDPVISGKNINVDLKMTEQGDAMEYKISVKNDSNADYEIDKNSFNIDSEYINYTLSFDDNSTIVKAGTSKVATLRVEYANPVPADVLLAGPVTDNKTITVNLSAGDGLTNPKTGVASHLPKIILLLVLSSIVFVVLRSKKSLTLSIILGTIIIPIAVSAVCKCEVNLTSSVEITNNPTFCYSKKTGVGTYEKMYYEYEEGMSLLDYINSDYYKDSDWILSGYTERQLPNKFTNNNNETEGYNEYVFSDKIGTNVPDIPELKPKEEGCYLAKYK